jgi:polyferredoxin
VQIAFVLLNLLIGLEFYFFVRQFETGGASAAPSLATRPPGVEGWLPIAGMMNTKYWLLTGHVPDLHPAAMVLFLTFLTASILFRKAFCGWLCPVGTLSEYLWKAGRHIFRRNFVLPRWLDIPLRSLKYILAGLFVYVVVTMSVEGITDFLGSPYGLIADVKMLNFFRFMGATAAAVIGFLLIGSVFVQNLWCRYLCPYGAIMGLASLTSPLRIRRDPVKCIDCAKCAKACPSNLQVDTLIQIRSAECLGCMECVTVCPAEGALWMSAPAKTKVSPWVIAAGVAGLFLAAVTVAQISGHWHSPIPNEVYRSLVPRAAELAHP